MTALLDPPDSAPPMRVAIDRLARPRSTASEDRIRLVGTTIAIALILTIGGLVVGGSFDGGEGVVSADEGAVLAQVDVVQRTGGYGMDYWAANVDPAGRWFPFHLADRHGDQWYLFTKKPLYVELVSAADRLAGRPGVIVFHATGVALAALAAAAVAGRLFARNRQQVQLATLWITGLGSPLVMDGAWVIAHGPAAAMAGLTAFGVASWWADGRRRGLLCVALGLFAGILLRNEALLLGGAVALVGAIAAACALLPGVSRAQTGGNRRSVHAKSRLGVGLTVAAVAGSGLGLVAATAWQRSAEGGSASGTFRISDQVGWFEARVLALWNVVLSPGAKDSPAGWLVAAAMVAIAVAWSPQVRRVVSGRATTALTVAAVVGLLASLVIGPVFAPGMLAAFPLGVAALTVGWPHRRRVFGGDLAAVLTKVWLTFGAAVLSTTYAAGGTGDWGGRYLHIGLPFITPVIALALIRAVERQPSLRSPALVLATTAIVVGLIGHGAFRQASSTTKVLADVPDLTAGFSPNSVVVSTNPAYGRWAWDRAVTGRYLTVRPDDPEIDVLVDSITPVLIIGSTTDAAQLVDRIEDESKLVYQRRLVSPLWTVWALAGHRDP